MTRLVLCALIAVSALAVVVGRDGHERRASPSPASFAASASAPGSCRCAAEGSEQAAAGLAERSRHAQLKAPPRLPRPLVIAVLLVLAAPARRDVVRRLVRAQRRTGSTGDRLGRWWSRGPPSGARLVSAAG